MLEDIDNTLAKLEVDNIYYNNLYIDYIKKNNTTNYIAQLNTIVYNLNMIDDYINKLNNNKCILNDYMYKKLQLYYK